MAAEELQLTPSQTVGPYWTIGMLWPDGPYVVPEGTPGAFWIRGRLYDGEGAPVPDGFVESWQADPDGLYHHPDDPRSSSVGDWRGFGRAQTDTEGRFALYTVKPGPVPGPDGTTQAPHLALSVFARGLLNRVVSRLYFADEAELNAADPVLATVPAQRRETLIAQPAAEDGYRFDIHLQGADETVFFAV
jgi:protocatechuate 3,4-dioxygenase, alpha subunit